MAPALARDLSWIGVAPSRALRARLESAGWRLRATGAGPSVVATAQARPPGAPPQTRWLWVSGAVLTLEQSIQAIRAGAYDAIALAHEDAPARLLARLEDLAAAEVAPPATPGIVAESPATRRLLRQVWQAARSMMPVLLTGETGTGKEVMAALVHRWSGRSGPYVPINCAAIPNDLMESELFGHTKGAFSGAVASVDGKLLAAPGGTVFLDEIDDTPLSVQNKLLRALEDGQVTRLGESVPRPADFRVVAASNRDLQRLIAEQRFGQDFYERLAIVRIELPRLRDRPEDIPALARHFLARFYERQGGPARVQALSPEALAALARHPWPGNIRELRNVIYQALVYKRAGSELLLSDLRGLLEARPEASPARPIIDGRALQAAILDGTFNLRVARDELEAEALRAALARTGGRPGEAARLLGEVGRGRSSDPGGTVRAMMRRLGVAGARGRARSPE